LSKEKAEKILEYKRKKADEFIKGKEENKIQNKKGSLLKELVQERIITESEAQTIKKKLREMKDARLSDDLKGLVDRGVLSANDIDNIRNYMLKDREERKVRLEKLKSMTPEERKVYFEETKKARKDILTKMVEDKVITEEQAKEIRKVIH
jgi:membrane peptidoglycan carboxypeptidase